MAMRHPTGSAFQCARLLHLPSDVPSTVPNDKLQTELTAHNPSHDPADELHVADIN